VNTKTETDFSIVSLSLNPAIDLTYEISTFLEHDKKSRALSTQFDPGGTGVNVGRALEKLKAKSHTCCITAGTMGLFLESLLKRELKHVVTLQVEGETRINTTLLQRTPQRQFEINASGPAITSQQLETITSQFLKLCGKGIGILTGSLPPRIPENTYQNICSQLQNQGGRAIVDASSEVMKKALLSKPFLIKPNLHELESIQGKKLNSIHQIALEARQIIQQGVKYVCVSMGEKGAILASPENSYYCNSPNITINSTVGAGDSMVAALAYSFAKNEKPEQALKLAVACGAGTAKQPSTQLFDAEDLELLSKQITVNTLNI
jgi:6-phosphofructokinase 2